MMETESLSAHVKLVGDDKDDGQNGECRKARIANLASEEAINECSAKNEREEGKAPSAVAEGKQRGDDPNTCDDEKHGEIDVVISGYAQKRLTS